MAHKSSHSTSKSTDIVEIGNELVTYEDTYCADCDRVVERKIINRSKIR